MPTIWFVEGRPLVGRKLAPSRRSAMAMEFQRKCFFFFHFIHRIAIAEPCIGTKDTACVDACPVDCIHPKKDDPRFEGEEMLYIDPVECIDCGACVPVCPVSAIFALDDLPEKWSELHQTKRCLFWSIDGRNEFHKRPSDTGGPLCFYGR